MQIIQLISITISIVLFCIVIDFIRRGMLKEKYAILWLGLTASLWLFSVWTELLDRLALMVGVAYAPSLLFFIAFIFLLLIILHYSVVISILTDKGKTMAQEIALLKEALREVREELSKREGSSNTHQKG